MMALRLALSITTLALIGLCKPSKALGLTIPPSLLARADHVVE
jgi:hypothetical protein